jgi:hypothetical protein
VENLMLFDDVFTGSNQYYFPNVTSLTVFKKGNESLATQAFIQQLKCMMSLSHLVHFKFSSECILGLLQIFREAPQLSSISTDQHILISLFNNRELCKIFNEKIKILDTGDDSRHSFKNLNEIDRFCKVFSNVEQLTCNVERATDVLSLLIRLPKLSSLKAFVNPLGRNFLLFDQQVSKLNLKIRTKVDPFTSQTIFPIKLYIWI